MTIKIAHNATVAKVIDADKNAKLEIQRVLSYKADGFSSGSWDGRSSFFDYTSGKFPAGFVHHVQAALQKAGHKTQIVRNPFPEPLGPVEPVVDTFGFDPRYDYQMHVVDKLLRHGKIIAQVATGGGKSRIAKLCYERIKRPTLFLTTRGVLMYQMKESFERDLKIPVSVFGDGEWGHIGADGKPKLTRMSVGMVQTFAARLREPDPSMSPAEARKQAAIREKTIELLQHFELVIGEEAHEASGNSYFEILWHCKNAHYRLALTATPFMKDSEEANMRLMAAFGPVAIRVSEELLIARGILAKPYFKYASPEKPERLKRSIPWQRAYKWGVVENEHRNAHIVKEVLRAAEYGLPSMILVQHKDHGETLLGMLQAVGVRARYIYGDHDQAERKSALVALGSGDIECLIGTNILDVGVDVPAVGLVVLAGAGKAEVAQRQRIGRGLRAKKAGPNVAFILDFTDRDNTYLKQHAMQRRYIVESTPGFAEGVLRGDDADFDYAGLGFKKISQPRKAA
jgi:superfamily II DNA or RNA helicase